MSVLIEPQVYLWTRDEYDKIAQLGFFVGKHVELIEGQVIEMSPMGSLHATAVSLTTKAVERAFTLGYFIRGQMPFNVGAYSEPEPDVAVIAGEIRDYAHEHPTDAALIIEVAETSLGYDRESKGGLYAKVGIADYWIVNLVDYQLEVYRDPQPDEASAYGFRYASRAILTADERVRPLAQPQREIAVADLLP